MQNESVNGTNDQMKLTLLATFVKKGSIRDTVLDIFENFDVINDVIFLLKDSDKPYQYILTYNVDKNSVKSTEIIENTVSLHRKKETNTLYTLNALNELVKSQNAGQLDKNFVVNWDNYKNSIVLTKKTLSDDSIELKKINTVMRKKIYKNKE